MDLGMKHMATELGHKGSEGIHQLKWNDWEVYSKQKEKKKSLHIDRAVKEGGSWEKDQLAGRHHRLNRRESEQTPGDGEGQGGLACCSPWAQRARHDWATEQKQPSVVHLC